MGGSCMAGSLHNAYSIHHAEATADRKEREMKTGKPGE